MLIINVLLLIMAFLIENKINNLQRNLMFNYTFYNQH